MKKPIEEQTEDKCKLCEGKGYYQENKGGDVHVCWKCLQGGKFNQDGITE